MKTNQMKTIGITTTVPSEILIAAGCTVRDLNNLFVTAKNPELHIEYAENEGFPKSMCAWIKGIYGVAISEEINTIIGVTEGDCSNTKSMLEVMRRKGITCIPFAFPQSKSKSEMTRAMNQLMSHFEVTREQVEKNRRELQPLRKKLTELDRLTYETNQVTGFENHLYLVSASDYNGHFQTYELEIDSFLQKAYQRQPIPHILRIAYVGVPPITSDLYEFIEFQKGHVVYNEVQREFAMLRSAEHACIEDQYLDFTYPYSFEERLVEIQKQIKLRHVDAVIHYTQSFCHKGIEDILLKESLQCPVLNIEGDKDFRLDARSKLRIEAFMDMLIDHKKA